MLATCDGTQVRLEDLSTGELVLSFMPQRMGNHMIAPAHEVFFSTDSKVLGVGSLESVQDYGIIHRAFDTDTGKEFPFSRNGCTIWEFDLFPLPENDPLRESQFIEFVPASKPFFLRGCDRTMIQALGGQATPRSTKISAPQGDGPAWTILQWPEFER